MLVELCCQALLNQILPKVDPQRAGLAIEIGVGTHAFYFQLFARLKFKTIAVEPLPTEEVRQLCRKSKVRLITSCIGKTGGSIPLYIGRRNGKIDYNLNSVRPDWLVDSNDSVMVSSQSLSALLEAINAVQITCLKIDVEGTEFDIIQQLKNLPQAQLPKVLMFEYGGGSTKDSKRIGWSPEVLQGTIKSLEIIRSLNYQTAIILDLAKEAIPQIFNLQSMSLEANTIFPAFSIYGNIIALQDAGFSETKITSICKAYGNNQFSTNLWDKLKQKLNKFCIQIN